MYKIITTLLSFALLLIIVAMGETISKQNDTIRLMDKCLNYSDIILDNNEVWDRDGSDYMCDYLNLRYELDSTFLNKYHKRYNSDN